MNGMMRFGKKRKLSPCYMGPYKILKRVGKVIYMFCSSNIPCVYAKGLYSSSNVNSPLECLWVKEDLFYEEFPVEILDSKIRYSEI